MRPIHVLAATMGAAALASTAVAQTQAKDTALASGWQALFDGKSLDGWKASDEPGTFKVVNGAIVAFGPTSHLYYVGPVQNHDFRDFELQLEVKTFDRGNSGVYFHTEWQEKGWPTKGYEVQVNNSYPDPSRTGGLWGIQDNAVSPVKDSTWFTLSIIVKGKRIVTKVNDKVIVDYTEGEHPLRSEELARRLLTSGTFALQGHDRRSEVHYRNIKVRVL